MASDVPANEDDWRKGLTVLPCGHEVLDAGQVHYCGYIGEEVLAQLDQAFAGSARRRAELHPDEFQFYRVHQVCELMFSQILFDLPRALRAIEEDQLGEAAHILERMAAWMKIVTPVVMTLGTMRPSDFGQFRTALKPASGAESLRSREIEVMAGIPEDAPRYARDRGTFYGYREFLDRAPAPGENDPKSRWWTDKLSALSRQQTLLGAFIAALARHGQSLASLYARRQRHKTLVALRYLADRLHLFDCAYAEFRGSHVELARKQMGGQPGTGHTSGVPYLRSTEHTRLFPELWALKKARKKSAEPPTGGWSG